MQRYRIHFLDGKTRVFVRESTAADDVAAITEAHRLSRNYAIEVWAGERRVICVSQAPEAVRVVEAPLQPGRPLSDRLCSGLANAGCDRLSLAEGGGCATRWLITL